MTRTIYDVQRDFALSSGLRSEVIWDSLAPDQSDILQQKIVTIIPDTERGKNQSTREKIRTVLFENVWLQRKYTNHTLLSAIVYILVSEERTEIRARESTLFSCHPIFRTRKCLNSDNSAGCCMIFIDEHGRVYQNWAQFVAENVLPKGLMVAPANGIYTFSDNDEVNLEYHLTPAALTKARVLNATDAMVGVGSLVATMPIAAALAFPIAAPVMAAATVVAVTSAAYTTLRSAMQLKDRRQHSQSTALTDREARKSWIGVGSGVLGLGATGATKALTCAAAAGQEISLTTQLAVNGINATSIVHSCTGIVNSAYDIYLKINDDEELSGMDALQLASSLLVFTHSVNNLKIASKVKTTGGRGSSVRSELRNQMRNIFDRISRETSKLRIGGGGGSLDIIRTVNDIPVGAALMSLDKINSHLNDGVAGGAAGIIKTFASCIIPSTLLSTSSSSYYTAGNEFNLLYLAEEFGNRFVQHITNPNSLLDVMRAMAQYLSDRTFRFLMHLARIFIEEQVDAIDRFLNTFISTEIVLYKILMQCVRKYSNFSYEFMESKTAEILDEISEYFRALNPINHEDAPRNCGFCRGYYYVCNL